MKELKVLFSNTVGINDKSSMNLKYVLIKESKDLDDGESCYGIEIEKELDGILERESVGGISYSKEGVTAMIKKLFIHEVTPMSMMEIIDDFVTCNLNQLPV